MSTHEDASIFRLKMLKERIKNAQPDGVIQTVGIDLFRSIRNDKRLWSEWERRTNYAQLLKANKDYMSAERAAMDASKKVAGVLIEIVKSYPDGNDPKYSDMFTAEIKQEFSEETKYPISDKIAAYLKDENYFSVEDKGELFKVSPSGRVWTLHAEPYDVGFRNNCNKVLKQHKDMYQFVQWFVDTTIYDDVVKKNAKAEDKLAKVFEELIEAIEPLENFLITDARALHTKDFENVQLAAASFDYSVLGRHTKRFRSRRKDEFHIKEARESGMDVCDELEYALLMNMQGVSTVSTETPQDTTNTNAHKPTRRRKQSGLNGIRYIDGEGQIEVIKSNGIQPTLFRRTEQEFCKAIFENTEKEGDEVSWDQLYMFVEGLDPKNETEEDKKKMKTWRKKMIDTRRRVNEAVSRKAGKNVEVVRLKKGETTFVRGI